ncbi:MAG: MFS transporter [Pseudomonadales bacterium]|jgi:MFS family permease|nr:MFS transporter [Pseudomonadales bacterium]
MSDESMPTEARGDDRPQEIGGLYAHYVLMVLVIVYVFNFIDRQILSILAESIKADLGVSDAQIGFLYGTVFAVFYAVFGIPLARFADVWVRRSLISAGLFFWSAMTALSGTARSFSVLALYRIGVGIGEASASPAAYSMLSDYYSPKRRATVIAIYSSGVYIGAGIGLVLGGWILDQWTASFPVNPPLGLKGWHVAFMAVGLPGLLMAAWVRTLREPIRGLSEGLVTKPHPAPYKVLGTEMAAVIPPFNIVAIVRTGASLRFNLIALVGIAIVAVLLITLTGSVAQWVATGIGVYVTISWAQSLKSRDPATFGMIFGSKAMIYTMIAFPTIAFVAYGVGFWTAPYLMRAHGATATEVGIWLGLGGAAGGFLGVTIGGIAADWLKTKYPSGRLVLGYVAIAGMVPTILALIYAESLYVAFWINFFATLVGACWPGVPPSTANDLVMPRMRAVAGAYYILVNTFIGLALGPYVIGQISDVFVANGSGSAEALRNAMACSMLIFVVSIFCLIMAQRHLPKDESSRLDRARAMGESLDGSGST